MLTALERGTLTAQPQPEAGASYAPKLTRELGRLNWQQPALTLHNLVRGLVPWPGATTGWRGTEVKIWRARVHAAPAASPPGTITAVLPEGLCVACGAEQLLAAGTPASEPSSHVCQGVCPGVSRPTGREF